MEESLWSEKTCSSLIPALPLWIIEYAWSHQMVDVLEVLGPPLWLEGDCGRLSLEEPYSIRVMAAEAWMVIRARDIEHFERAMEFLEVTRVLMPQIVTSIKHMKIIFGLKTLVIMWMLWDDQSETSITNKIASFFPDDLLQYRRSTRRHLELMQKTQQDFRRFAQCLARNADKRHAYIRDLLEEQYGERYVMKLEERLLDYLKELDKALPQPTYIDQVLKQSLPLDETEKLLHQLLTCKSSSLPTALKRLLRCAIASHSTLDVDANKQRKQTEADRPGLRTFCIALRPSQENQEENMSQKSSQRTWLSGDKSPSLLQKSPENIHLEGPSLQLKPKSGQRPRISPGDMDPCVAEHHVPQREESEQNNSEEVTEEHLCSRHGKRMKSILLECSEELKGQNSEPPLVNSECTPPSPPASPLHDSSSTYVSLSSHPDSSTNHSPSSQASSGQPVNSPFMSPEHQNTPRTSLVQQLNISALSSHSADQILPVLLPSLQKSTPSLVSSGRPSLSQMPLCLSTDSSSFQQESSSLMFSKNQIRSPASSSSSTASSQSHSSVQIPGTARQDFSVMSGPDSVLRDKMKLSMETQSFFLQCKWLQPHVLLYRCSCSQQDSATTSLPNRTRSQQCEVEEAEEEEEDFLSFDVNLLYSDSESDPQESDDPDYIPPKKPKAWVDW